jgi:hypothetical protein
MTVNMILDDHDLASSSVDGIRREGEFYCSSCGYGVSRWEPPAACPMCQTSAWHRVHRRGTALVSNWQREVERDVLN